MWKRLVLLWRLFRTDARRLWFALRHPGAPTWLKIGTALIVLYVLSRIGRPATTWPIAYQRQIVWSYRYESPFCQWFMVGMGQEGKVVDTAYGPDPLCEPDDFFTRLRSRR